MRHGKKKKKPLPDPIKFETHTVISNLNQRKVIGGWPALVINHDKFNISTPVEDHISLPWGVEATSAMIVPKNLNSDSKVKRILIMSIYSKP